MAFQSGSRCCVAADPPARGAAITTHFCPYSYCTLKEKGNDGGRGESLAWQGEGEGEGERANLLSLPTLTTVWSYVDSRLDQQGLLKKKQIKILMSMILQLSYPL